jgi:hypothetical protein
MEKLKSMDDFLNENNSSTNKKITQQSLKVLQIDLRI